MDIAKIKRNRGRLSGFIMGLIASIYGGLFAFIIGTAILAGHQDLFFIEYDNSSATTVAILLFLTAAITIVGASLIRGKRIIGGILIIGASAPLFVVSIVDPAAFSIFGFTSIVCIAAGIIALIPLSDSFLQKLAIKQQYESHMAAFIEHQQSQQGNDAISVTPISNTPDTQPPDYPDTTAKKDDGTRW